MTLPIITENEKFVSYLINETNSFIRYVIINKEEDIVEISCRDKIFETTNSIYLTESDIKNIYEKFVYQTV